MFVRIFIRYLPFLPASAREPGYAALMQPPLPQPIGPALMFVRIFIRYLLLHSQNMQSQGHETATQPRSSQVDRLNWQFLRVGVADGGGKSELAGQFHYPANRDAIQADSAHRRVPFKRA